MSEPDLESVESVMRDEELSSRRDMAREIVRLRRETERYVSLMTDPENQPHQFLNKRDEVLRRMGISPKIGPRGAAPERGVGNGE